MNQRIKLLLTICTFITTVLTAIGFVAWNADGFGLQRGFVMGICMSIGVVITSTIEATLRMGGEVTE
jgi:predicted RND superfamily exporter protein